MEAFLLFGNAILGFIALTVLLILFFVGEHEENGFISFFSFAIALALFWFWGNLPIKEYFQWKYIAMYFTIGLIFCLIRCFFYGRYVRKEFESQTIKTSAEYTKDHLMKQLSEHCFRWWFQWPISLIYWFCSDMIKAIWDFIFSKTKSLFIAIAKLGFESK